MAASGTTRDISPIFYKDGDLKKARYIHYHVARVLGLKDVRGWHDAVRVYGAGMDMGFDLVDQLGRALWPDGWNCLGNDACLAPHNEWPRVYDASVKHHGFALKAQWL